MSNNESSKEEHNFKECPSHCGRYFSDTCEGDHQCGVDPCDFIHCSPLQGRLAGLQGRLSFQLFCLKGCRVKIHFECASMDNHVTGTICNVTNETVDILEDSEDSEEKEDKKDKKDKDKDKDKKDKKDKDDDNGGRVVTIMLSRICKIEWLDEDCNPCRKHHGDDSCPVCDQ